MSTDTSVSNFISICETLFNLFQDATAAAYPNLVDPPIAIAVAPNAKFGDYEFSSSMQIVKLLNTSGKYLKSIELFDINVLLNCKYYRYENKSKRSCN